MAGDTTSALRAAQTATRFAGGELLELPLESIERDPNQPRWYVEAFDGEEEQNAVQEVADSLAARGQLTPIQVYASPSIPAKYRLFDGERRWRAAQSLQWASIQAMVVRHEDLDAGDLLAHQVVTSLERRPLGMVDLAHAYARILELKGWSQSELSEHLGKKPASISKALAPLKATGLLKEGIDNGLVRTTNDLEKLKGAPEKRRNALLRKHLESGEPIERKDLVASLERKKPVAKPTPTKSKTLQLQLTVGALTGLEWPADLVLTVRADRETLRALPESKWPEGLADRL